MRYDIYLESTPCGTCGRKGEEPMCPDPTFNLAGIFHLALTGKPYLPGEPRGLRILTGMTGAESLSVLDAAIERVGRADMRAAFEALEPPNKWGTVSDGEKVLRRLRDFAVEYPDNRWRVA